jgi:hypothetical protein
LRPSSADRAASTFAATFAISASLTLGSAASGGGVTPSARRSVTTVGMSFDGTGSWR